MKGTEVFDPRSHYFVQRRRRFGFLEDWRRRRRAIARGDDVRLERSPARRAAFGFLAGGDSKVPMRVIDARILEVAPGETTSTHRHTAFADVTLRASPKGSRSALLVDRTLGYRTTGISLAMFEIRPGGAQSKHRHPGEALLYIVDGEGYSVIDDVKHEWRTGDAAIVHQYVWHQHFNASAERPATVIRMHMWESVIEMMQAAMDPVPLYEDEPGLEQRMREVVGAPEE